MLELRLEKSNLVVCSNANFEQYRIWTECEICSYLAENHIGDSELGSDTICCAQNESPIAYLSRSTTYTHKTIDLSDSANHAYVRVEESTVH